MIEDYETTKAKILLTYREINDLDVALALHGIENPEDIAQLSEDENFIAQYKLIHAQFLRELLGNVKVQAKGKGQIALSATKLLLQTYHPAKFNTQLAQANTLEVQVPPDREFKPVDASDDTQDPEMKEILEAALEEENDPHDVTNKDIRAVEKSGDPEAPFVNGEGSNGVDLKDAGPNGQDYGIETQQTRLDKLKAELNSRNKPSSNNRGEEFFDVVLPKNKRTAITRLNK